MRRSTVYVFAGALAAVLVGCAGARSEGSIDREAEAFYVAFEDEVRASLRKLGPDEREQLGDIMPLAEVEGATNDVLDVIETRPSLRPTVRGIRRFLRDKPSNWVQRELVTGQGDRRLWHILLDTIREELVRAPA